MSIRCKDSNRAVIIEALRRARYKFPGRQKIIVSKKWGFTSLDRPDYEALKRDKKVINDGAYVQVSRGACKVGSLLTVAVPQAQGKASPKPPNCRSSLERVSCGFTGNRDVVPLRD